MPRPSDAADIPYAQLFNLLIRVLRQHGGTASVNQQLESVIQYTKFGGDVRKLRSRLGWLRTTLKTLGLIRNAGRGTWQLTDLGELGRDLDRIQRRAAPRTFTQPPRINYFSPERVRSSPDRIELLLYVEPAAGGDVEVQPLTADYLKSAIVPLIAAFDDIQWLLSFEWNLQLPPLALIALHRTNPTITLQGSGEIIDGILKHHFAVAKETL